MPTFGDYETSGEALATTDDTGHLTQIWLARKIGATAGPIYALKIYTPKQRRRDRPASEETLEQDRALEFLEGIKQIKKAQSEGGKAGRRLTPIHGFGKTHDGQGAWYVTDFYGEAEPFLPRSLQSYIMRGGRLDGGALRHIVHSVVAGCLALKKSRGYSHGNLKSSNIFRAGKPRPLRKTPLQLADAFPAAPLQLAKVDPEHRPSIGELLQQTMEAQDLRAIGELLLQLVEGRLIASERDYDYPVPPSPAWSRLGKQAERWRELCNRLLNPSLSLERVNLAALEKEFRPSPVSAPVVLASLALAGLLGVAGYFGSQWWQKQIKIRAPPQSQTSQLGASVTFTVAASSRYPLSFQWRSNGTTISGETSSNLVLSGLPTPGSFTYDVIVSNQYGSVTSAPATLTVNVPVPQITDQPRDQTITNGGSAIFTISATGPAPLKFQWRLNGKEMTGATNNSLTASNAGSYDVAVSNEGGSTNSRAALLAVHAVIVPPQITNQPQDQTLTNGGSATLAVGATGTPPLLYQWRLNGKEMTGATNNSLTASNAGSYDVAVSNEGGAKNSQAAVLAVHAAIVPPEITAQPLDQTNYVGSNAVFSVAAKGTAPLKYQWSFSGREKAGATGSSLTLSNLAATDAGSYSVTVSNEGGSTNSRAALLAVHAVIVPPQITNQPQDQTLTNGGSATLAVGATGTAPLLYQWRLNGKEMTGATNNSLTASNAGSYDVAVSNEGGSTTSQAALLTVLLVEQQHPPTNLFGIDFVWVKGVGANAAGAYVAVYELSLDLYHKLKGTAARGDVTNQPALLPSAQEARSFADKQNSDFASKGFHVRLPTLQEYLTMTGVPKVNMSGLTKDQRDKIKQDEHLAEGKVTDPPSAVTSGLTNQQGLLNALGNVREWTSDNENPFGFPTYYRRLALFDGATYGNLNAPPYDSEQVGGLRLVLEPASAPAR